jgi:hypothetical protein
VATERSSTGIASRCRESIIEQIIDGIIFGIIAIPPRGRAFGTGTPNSILRANLNAQIKTIWKAARLHA